MSRKRPTNNIIDSRHPNYLSCMSDWEKWRLAYRGGDEFRDRFLEQFSAREEQGDFNSRRAVTPIPAFAKAAVNDIRNSIYQRMGDVSCEPVEAVPTSRPWLVWKVVSTVAAPQ